jgi:2-dehydropantoate 2-reductase
MRFSDDGREGDNMTEKTLIWGAGAVGGTVGAFLVRAGYDVTFVDVNREHVEAIRSPLHGLRISGPVDDLGVIAPAATPDQVQGTWARVFLAVKAQDTEEACKALAPYLARTGYVLSLQNGLCESIIASIVGRQQTVGAFVNFGADWMAPGEIVYSNRGAVVVGELDGSVTERLRELHAQLQAFEPEALLTGHIWSYLWGKLGYGSLLFAQATGQLGIADCLARPELLPLWRDLAGEAVQVALAEGTEPRGFNGFDPAAFRPGVTEDRVRETVAAMVAFNRPNAKTHSGVWRDLAIRKRRTEVDLHVAAVVHTGRRHGLACPKLSALVRMIHEIEDGKRPLSDDNLCELLHA